MEKLPCLLNQAAVRFGEAPAVITENQQISFLELEGWVQGTATALAKKGVQQGECVAMILPSCLEYLILVLALFRLGSIACPLNPQFPAAQIKQLLQNLGASWILTHRESHKELALSTLDVQKLVQLEENPAHSPIFFEEHQPATVIFTSGSSGQPKAVLHSYGNHYFNALGSHENIAIALGDRWLLSLPLFHVGGLAVLFRMLLGGGAVVIPQNPQAIATNLQHYRITHTSLVNTQFLRLLQSPDLEKLNARLKGILLGGGAIAQDLLKKAQALHLPLFVSYGSTEMASQVTTTAPGASWEELKTAGKLLRHRQLKISAEGEIWTQGKTRFLGYLSKEKLTLPFDAQGWFHTGDCGYFEKNALVVVGRRDRMFISGGENIYPEEIEQALATLPEVQEAVVVPVENQEFGWRPAAFLKMHPLMPREEALARLQPLLPRYKIPDFYFPWPDPLENLGLKNSPEPFKKIAQKWVHQGEA